MSIRDRVEDSIARQQEWGTDNGPYFVGTSGTEDMRMWDDEQWNVFETFNDPEADMMSFMDMDLSRLKNYM